MTDHSELKRLAENSIGFCDVSIAPDVVLALIAEVEGLRAQHGRDSAELRNLCQARDDARKERDQLKTENEKLKEACERADAIICSESKDAALERGRGNLLETKIEKLKAENEALRKDRQRLNFIESQNHKTLKFHKKKWSFQGFTNYEYSVFGSLREAIDDAMNEVG